MLKFVNAKLIDTHCEGCKIDAKRMNEWRDKGGPMPTASCAVDHRLECAECGERSDDLKSCNKCGVKL